MVRYLMMDESHILPYCLHKGPAPVSDLADPEAARARAEAEWGLVHGPVVPFLRAVSRTYGATGVMVVDGEVVIGKLRFAPKSLPPGCVQLADEMDKIADIDLERLTPKEELCPKSLCIWCSQLIPRYRGQGIGTNMLTMAIEWARTNGWEEMHSMASRHIRPILDVTGMPSMERLSRLGFVETGHSVHPDMRELVVSMRGGHHGEEVREQWEQYADLSDDEASWVYDAVLDLRGNRPLIDRAPGSSCDGSILS